MAGNADGRCIAVVAGLVALPAVHDFMALRKWEKIVRNILSRPVKGIRPVAISALYGVARSYVIGIGRRSKVSIVAVDTGIAYPVKFKAGFGEMAGIAVGGRVGSQQRETIVEVEFHDVVYQPAFRRVAAAAVITYRHSVHIGMAADAVRAGFRKNEGGMARTTVYLPVLSVQYKAGGFMLKSALFIS
jgi:hypothetical protein